MLSIQTADDVKLDLLCWTENVEIVLGIETETDDACIQQRLEICRNFWLSNGR